jgi:predicted transcriptional regulator
MTTMGVKQEARRLVEQLPEDATWDELRHEVYVRQTIEAGLQDSQAGRTLDIKEVRARFG